MYRFIYRHQWIWLFAAVLTLFSACAGEEEDIFDQSAAERLNAASDLYSARLTAQPNGWAMQLYPTNDNDTITGRGYLVLLRFHKNHQVDAAMRNLLTSNKYVADTSMWQVITDDGPVLTFNTYNSVIHTFSSPEDIPQTGTTGALQDETGTGVGGDYEFIVVDAPEDASYMMLKGKKRATYNYLTPMEEGVDFESYINDVQAFQRRMFPVAAPTEDYVHYGDSVCIMTDFGHGLPNIYPVGGDPVINETFNPFIVTKLGDTYHLRFRDAKVFGNETIQDYRYDPSIDRFVSLTDPDNYYIEGEDPYRFFSYSMDSLSITWSYNLTDSASDDIHGAMQQIQQQFQAINRSYRPSRFQIRIVGDQLQLHLPYANSGRTAADYNMTMTTDGSSVKFAYQNPATTAAQNILNRIPAIQTLLDLLCTGNYSVSAATTRFDLSRVKLDNGSQWITFTK